MKIISMDHKRWVNQPYRKHRGPNQRPYPVHVWGKPCTVKLINKLLSLGPHEAVELHRDGKKKWIFFRCKLKKFFPGKFCFFTINHRGTDRIFVRKKTEAESESERIERGSPDRRSKRVDGLLPITQAWRENLAKANRAKTAYAEKRKRQSTEFDMEAWSSEGITVGRPAYIGRKSPIPKVVERVEKREDVHYEGWSSLLEGIEHYQKKQDSEKTPRG
jgi:hypothetical protein